MRRMAKHTVGTYGIYIYIYTYEVCPKNSRIYRVKIFPSYLEATQPCRLQSTPLYSVCTADSVSSMFWSIPGKLFLGMLRKCASECVLTASIDSKRRPFSVDLSFGNRKKSDGARSGEYGGCGRTVVACLAKKSRKLDSVFDHPSTGVAQIWLQCDACPNFR